jgi:hypothetical protein
MYKLWKNNEGNISSIIKTSDNTYIPFSAENADYQAYLKWVAEGNTPLPADEGNTPA